LARVAYNNSDIALIDDPLSAVDSHVAKHILQHCLLAGPLASRTRVLVTHQLYVLPYADEVIFLQDGRVTERGHFRDLVAAGGDFAKLMEEYGSEEAQTSEQGSSASKGEKDGKKSGEDKAKGGSPTKLVQGDERETGSVSA
jgi:ATP-binding cassette subfamily C (CFTR/MRP) protein 1